VISGVMFGVLFAVGLRYLAAETWTAALVSGAIAGPAFGLAMAFIRRQEQRLSERLDDTNLTAAQKRAARKATWGGPTPADPAVRAVARGYAEIELHRLGARWLRALTFGMLALELAASVLNVLARKPWPHTLLTLGGALLFGWSLLRPRHLRKRIKALSANAPQLNASRPNAD
jgi:hypothetical protein